MTSNASYSQPQKPLSPNTICSSTFSSLDALSDDRVFLSSATNILPDGKSSLTGKKWHLRPALDGYASHTQGMYGPDLSSFLKHMLNIRGVPEDEWSHFLEPTLRYYLKNPFHLKDMDKAVARLYNAILRKERIYIFGDYDVDGATSTALLTLFLQSIGILSAFYIPHREKEGYGPTKAAMAKLHHEGAQVIITVDCGASAFEALEHAASLGVDVIVVDHHLGEAQLPKAAAVLNPNRHDESTPLKYLAAVGVTFLLLIALRKKLRDEGWFQQHKITEPDLFNYLDLVALGTVCDVMPLKGLNRAIVRQGLTVMERTSNIGLQALKKQGGIVGAIDTYHLGFILGPRINAAGRIDDATLGTRLLICQEESGALAMAERLGAINNERQLLEKELVRQAHAFVKEAPASSFIALSKTGWAAGLIGLVAGRLKEKHYCPTFITSFDDKGMGKGSARSVRGVDMGALLHRAKEEKLILGGGGHAMAGGYALLKSQYEAFHIFLQKEIGPLSYPKIIDIDYILSLGALTLEFMAEIEKLAPFGPDNPRPKFCLKSVFISYPKQVGEHHIKCTLVNEQSIRLPAIAFRALEEENFGASLMMAPNVRYDVVGTPQLNHWNGQTHIQFQIEDLAQSA